jgi:ribosome assembly protein YihI (activator of Der GTPase)
MQETAVPIFYASPPSTPQLDRCRRFSMSESSLDVHHSSSSGTPTISSSSSPPTSSSSFADCTRRSILEMDRERRARREEAKKEQGAKSVLHMSNQHLESSSTLEEEEDISIGSPEGVPSSSTTTNGHVSQQEQSLLLGRGPFSHKRRRLCHRTTMPSTIDPCGGAKLHDTVFMPPPPKTSYSPPAMFTECDYFYRDGFSEQDFHENASVLMPSLKDDEEDSANDAFATALTMTMPLLYTESSHNKRKAQHQRSNSPFLGGGAPPLGSRRSSPLHFYHAQKQQQQQQQQADSPAGYSSASSTSSVEQLLCRLRPRRSITLEEEFTRQLTLFKDDNTPVCCTRSCIAMPSCV